MAYPQFGGKPIIPAADLLNPQSAANSVSVGNARVGDSPASLGKKAGKDAIRDAGSGDYRWVFSLGDKNSDGWRVCDGSATYLPLNLAAYTVGGDSTYAAGLLTTDGGNDAAGRATQVITALPAGKYLISGSVAAEGTTGAHIAPRLNVTGATDGAYISNKVFHTPLHATAAESANPKGTFAQVITLTVAQNVTIQLDLVDQAGALSAGSAYIVLNPLEATR